MSTITPYPFQVPVIDAAVKSLTERRYFINGLPTGAGKTVIALAAAKALNRPTLVVAPKVSLTQWRRMAEAMSCQDLLISVINPERISTPRGCEFYTRAGRWQLPPSAHVIWDEPHRNASGIKGVTTRALAELKLFGVALHAMSATLADSPLKLRALGWWAGFHQFNEPSFYGWCRDHGCENVDRGRWDPMAAGRTSFKFTSSRRHGVEIMTGIRADFGDAFVSMKAEDIPGFPEEIIEVVLLDLNRRDRAEIDSAYAAMSERMKSRAGSQMAEDGRERERIEFVMAEALAEKAVSGVSNGNSVVVFLCFTEPRLRFVEKYKALTGSVPPQIYGQQRDSERQSAIDAFQSNREPCIVVNQQAGGASVSLHDVLKERPRESLIIPSWRADDIKQCRGRIRRCEGTRATQKLVLAAGTVQERVAATLQRKLGNIDALHDNDLIP